MLRILLIALGGSLGTLARYGTGGLMHRILAGSVFPWGTLAVNLLGCFVIGYVNGLFSTRLVRPDLALAATIGFLGGYTTFSSFGWESAAFLREGQWGLFALNVLANNVIGLALVIAGYQLSRLAH